MAQADITKAMIATWFGGTLTSYLGKWVALQGDDGGTPTVMASASSLPELLAYIGANPNPDVAEGTAAIFICRVPNGMG